MERPWRSFRSVEKIQKLLILLRRLLDPRQRMALLQTKFNLYGQKKVWYRASSTIFLKDQMNFNQWNGPKVVFGVKTKLKNVDFA